MMKIRFEDWGGRRFLLTVATLAAATLTLWFGKIDAAVWRDVMIGIVGIYVAGNTVQKVKGTAPVEGS